MTNNDGNIPALDEKVVQEIEQERVTQSKNSVKTAAQAAMTIELDWNVPHGQTAIRSRAGVDSNRANVAGSVQVRKQSEGAGEQKPTVGKSSPLFRAVTFDGKLFDLAALRGKKTWLIFYRYATCPLCNLHISQIHRQYEALKASGLEVVAVFDSRVPEFYAPGGLKAVRFPIISDTDRKLYDLYTTRRSLLGVFRPSVLVYFIRALLNGFKQGPILGDLGQLPSSFLIDAKGIIQEIHHGKTAVDYLPWWKVGKFAGIAVNSSIR